MHKYRDRRPIPLEMSPSQIYPRNVPNLPNVQILSTQTRIVQQNPNLVNKYDIFLF